METRRALLAGMLSVLVLCPLSVVALDPNRTVTQYTLTTWQSKDGLPQETLMCIAQTTDGELWLGAPAGLIRFDGTRFRKVPLPPDATPGDQYITDMIAVEDNGLWFTTRDGLFFRSGELFVRWGIEHGLPPGGALQLARLDDGTLALATDRGVIRFDPATGSARPLAGVEKMAARVLSVSLGRGGRYWAGTMRGLLQLEVVSPEYPVVRNENPDEIVNAVLEDSCDRLWVGTSLGLTVVEPDGTVQHLLKGRWIRCLLEDRDGNIWIGSRGNGAWRLRNGRLEPFSVKQGLPDDLIRDLFEDRNGSLWFVTGGGLARLSDGPVQAWTVREGLPVPFVWSVYEDPSRVIWVGTSGGGVVFMGPDGPERPPFHDPGLIGVEIRSFLTDRAGRFWIATSGNGLARVEDRKVRWERWNGNPARNRIYCLLEDRDGIIWIGTGQGLARMEEPGRVRWLNRGSSASPLTIRSLYEDDRRRLWVGTTTGLFFVDGNGLRPVPGAGSLATSRIHQIRASAAGGLWLATDSGIGWYKDGRLVVVNSGDGLPNNMIYWILDDQRGYFWVSCDVGVVRIRKSELDAVCDGRLSRLEALVIGRSDGMPSTECNSGFPAGVRGSDGWMWFPTTNGVARVSPALVQKVERVPAVRIDEVWLDHHVVGPLQIAAETMVSVPRNVRRVEIRYSAISLLAAEKLAFRYRLEGFDQDWVNAGSNRRAVFTALPSGIHRFELSARHGLGAWSPPVTVTLNVIPSFVETPGFYGLVILFITLSGWLVVRIRTARLRLRKEELEGEVAKRTEELRIANEQLAAANEKLERLAVQDALTGLANRRRLDAALREEWGRCIRNGTTISLLMIDVDHFKLFNDTYGHGEGDRCLQFIARVIANYARRPSDLAARFGGEEFVLMLPGAGHGAAGSIADRLREDVERLAIPHESSPVRQVVTVSIGWSCMKPEVGQDPGDLIRIADEFLYRAKRIRNAVAGPEALLDEN